MLQNDFPLDSSHFPPALLGNSLPNLQDEVHIHLEVHHNQIVYPKQLVLHLSHHSDVQSHTLLSAETEYNKYPLLTLS